MKDLTEDQKQAIATQVNEIVGSIMDGFGPIEQKVIIEGVKSTLESHYESQIIENNSNLEQSKIDYKDFTEKEFEFPITTN